MGDGGRSGFRPSPYPAAPFESKRNYWGYDSLATRTTKKSRGLLPHTEEPRVSNDKLQRLGYDESYFVYAAQAAGPELRAFLGDEMEALVSAMAFRAVEISSALAETFENAEYSLGAELARIEPLVAVPGIEAPCPLGQRDFIAGMPPVRNQQARGTCVAYAVVAAYERFLVRNGVGEGGAIDMSEQFLYWNCKRNDGIPNKPGTWIAFAAPLLARDGVCLESTWAYVAHDVPGNEGQGPPPPRASVESLRYRGPNVRKLAPTSVQDIRSELCAGRAVAFSVPVYNSWYANNYVKLTGQIGLPVPGEIPVGGHAMCFVGYEDLPDNSALGGGRFWIRNSWGDVNWAPQSVTGTAGYGTIPYAYIARFGLEAYCVE